MSSELRFPADGFVEHHISFEGIGAADVVIFPSLAPIYRLVLLATESFAFHLHEAILHRAVVIKTDRVITNAGLLEDVWL